jgi:hypothetical protein
MSCSCQCCDDVLRVIKVEEDFVTTKWGCEEARKSRLLVDKNGNRCFIRDGKKFLLLKN